MTNTDTQKISNEKTEALVKKTRTSLPAIPEIPEEKIQQAEEITSHIKKYLKLAPHGFLTEEGRTFPFFRGRIRGYHYYWMRWLEGQDRPDKIPYTKKADQPEGFSLRCDLEIDVDGDIYVLPLPPSSAERRFSPYVASLKKHGLSPTAVITRFDSKPVKSLKGKTFNVCLFTPEEELDPMEEAEDVPEPEVDEDDIPF